MAEPLADAQKRASDALTEANEKMTKANADVAAAQEASVNAHAKAKAAKGESLQIISKALQH